MQIYCYEKSHIYRDSKIRDIPFKVLEEMTPADKFHDKVIITLDQKQIFDLMDAVERPTNMTDRQKKFHNFTMFRGRAILTSFLGTGMRVSELAGLDVTDIDFNNQTFRVIRKGGNEAYIYFGDDVWDTLCYYLGIQKESENTRGCPTFYQTAPPVFYCHYKFIGICFKLIFPYPDGHLIFTAVCPCKIWNHP